MPVAFEVEGHFMGYAACGNETPCGAHPGGAIDTVRDAVRLQAKWKADARRKRREVASDDR